MALNIKPLYPYDHPTPSLSVGDLIKKISEPQESAAYLKVEIKKEEIFHRNEDAYGLPYLIKKRSRDYGLNKMAHKLLDQI